MSETEWVEVPGATWADIREEWKFDYAVLRGDDKFVPFHGVISTSNHYDGIVGKEHILLRAFRPVVKPKPTVAFVKRTEYSDAEPAFRHEGHYYSADDGEFIDHKSEVEVICDGIVVPAEELMEMRAECDRAVFVLPETRAFLRRCEELGVFGNE